MTWFFVALIAPFLWSIVNHVDKYLVSKYFHGGGIGGLMIFVGIIAALTLPIIWIFIPNIFQIVGTVDIAILLATGLLYNVGILLYMYSLEKEDASVVVSFWQLVPVFSYFLGVFILGEYFSTDKILASLLVIIGALLLSIHIKDKKISIRGRVAILMTFSALFLALGYVLFRLVAIQEYPFFVSLFWNQVGMVIFALICLAITSYRRQFVRTIKENSRKILSLNLAEQIIENVGIIVNNFALLLAPAAMVVLIEYSAQPLFVFIEGVILTLLFPNLIKEDISKPNVILKGASILIMIVGIYFVV